LIFDPEIKKLFPFFYYSEVEAEGANFLIPSGYPVIAD
jgi:hypothetical protein